MFVRPEVPPIQQILFAYVLSGFIALGYQVAWFRFFVDRFGCSSFTFLLVVCGFIGGLGAGSLASRSVTRRLARDLDFQDPLRVYGAIELIIAALALLTVVAGKLPATSWGHFPYVPQGVMVVHHPLYQFSKAVIAAACVLAPCFFMGTTFPLICWIYQHDERFPSRLYAWNTLGACAGILVCQMLLLPSIGHEYTYLVAFSLNLFLGAWFVVRGDAHDTSRNIQQIDESEAKGSHGTPLLLWLAILSGLLTGCLEGDLYKRLSFLNINSGAGMALLSFWAIVAIFCGSVVVRTFRSLGLRHIQVATVAAVAIYVYTGTHLNDLEQAFDRMNRAEYARVAPPHLQDIEVFFFPSSYGQLFLAEGLLVFPTYFLVSLLFPYTCNRLQEDRHHVGRAAGLNTLAFCAGMLLFSRLAPRIDAFYSMKLMYAVFAVLAGAVVLAGRGWSGWHPLLVLAGLVTAAASTPRGFDRTMVSPTCAAALYPVDTLKSNGEDTTYVVEDPSGPRLFFNVYSMSGTSRSAARYMRLMSHYPLLAHPDPKRALHIGFGCGNTTSATALHRSIRNIDVVELNENVIATAPRFAAANREVYKDPRVEFIRDDGRNFLHLTDRSYDMITTEPPPPMYPGIHRLYSLDFYQSARARLTPRGLLSQWLPIYQMPPEAVALAISSFLAAFDHAVLLAGFYDELILVGSQQPIDVALIERRLGELPEVRAELANIGIDDAVSLMSLHLMGNQSLRRNYPTQPVILDRRNDLEFLYARPGHYPVIQYDPYQVLEDLQAERLACHAELKARITDLGLLVNREPEFSLRSLSHVRSSPERPVALADMDWLRYLSLIERMWVTPKIPPYTEEIAILREMLALSPGLAGPHANIAALLSEIGQHEEAAKHLAAFRARDPGDPRGVALEEILRARREAVPGGAGS